MLGLPNAGKSTFLSVCSNAKPKIADYPFTTLHPNLGVVRAGDTDFVVADIPGLIEGASEGHGLGDRFLGHVERTAVLLHLIDCTQDDLAGAYQTIRDELEKYDHAVTRKPEIIALTKSDALGDELAEDQRQTLEKALGKPVLCFSSVAKKNLDPILFELAKYVRENNKRRAEEDAPAPIDDEDGLYHPTSATPVGSEDLPEWGDDEDIYEETSDDLNA